MEKISTVVYNVSFVACWALRVVCWPLVVVCCVLRVDWCVVIGVDCRASFVCLLCGGYCLILVQC